MLLGYCWYVLFAARVSCDPDAELYDFLIQDLSATQPGLLEFRRQVAAPPKKCKSASFFGQLIAVQKFLKSHSEVRDSNAKSMSALWRPPS